MLIVGERINSTRKSIDKAVKEKDFEVIKDEVIKQTGAGAHILDVNCGTVDVQDEPATMEWLVKTIQNDIMNVPLCIDSANPEAVAAGLAVHQGQGMINSISGETDKLKQLLPLVKKYNALVVALCIDDNGIPKGVNEALKVGDKIVNQLLDAGVPIKNIYFDPLVRSVATNPETVAEILRIIEGMADKFKGLHFISGLSNVSFGLPERRHLNRAYLVLSIAAGLDAVIVDPLDSSLISLTYATSALLNKDKYSMKYIKAHKDGKLKG